MPSSPLSRRNHARPDGPELAIAMLSLRPDLLVLLMSGNVSQALEQRARDARVLELLRKPLALQELADGLAGVFAASERANP
jgi:hypothetical protein